MNAKNGDDCMNQSKDSKGFEVGTMEVHAILVPNRFVPLRIEVV